jgi:hypothetical protein
MMIHVLPLRLQGKYKIWTRHRLGWTSQQALVTSGNITLGLSITHLIRGIVSEYGSVNPDDILMMFDTIMTIVKQSLRISTLQTEMA